MSDPVLTDPLPFAVAVFDRWRERRATVGARVPTALRQIACRLLDVEPRAHVARALHVPEPTLARWQARNDGQRRLAAAHPGVVVDALPSTRPFVPLPPSVEREPAASTPTNTPTPIPALVIERPDGVRLHLGGPIDIATVAALLATETSR